MSDADFTIVFVPSFQSTGKVLSHADLGVGFDVARMQTQKKKILDGSVRKQTNEFSVQQYEKIESLSDITEKMDVGGELEVSYGLISGRGQGSAFEKSVTNQRTVTIMYSARHQKSYVEMDCPKLTDEAGSICDVSKLTEKFGTHYVGRIMYGASLSIMASLTCSSKEVADELKAEIEGSIGIGKLSLKVKAYYERRGESMESSLRFSCDAKSYGLNISEPQPESIDGIDAYIRKWETERAKRFASGDFMSMPIAATIMVSKPWVPLFDLSDSEMGKMMENVRESRKMMLESLFEFASVSNVESYLRKKYDTPRDRECIYRPWAKQTNSWKEKRDADYRRVLNYLIQPVRYVVHNAPPRFSTGSSETYLDIIGRSYMPIDSKYYYEGFVNRGKTESMAFVEGQILSKKDRSLVKRLECLEAVTAKNLLGLLSHHHGFYCGAHFFDFKRGSYKGSQTAVVKFPVPFEQKPRVSVFLSTIGCWNDRNMRISCDVISTHRNEMVIECKTWADTNLWSATVSWIALDQNFGKLGDSTFDFRKAQGHGIRDLRSSVKVLGPALGVAIRQLDVGCQANTRLNTWLENKGDSVDVVARTWYDSVLYSIKVASFALLEPLQCGRMTFEFGGNNGTRELRKYVKFPEPFDHIPNVTVGLCELDLSKDQPVRLAVKVEEGSVTTTGMYLRAQTWKDSHLWNIGVYWVAGPSQ